MIKVIIVTIMLSLCGLVEASLFGLNPKLDVLSKKMTSIDRIQTDIQSDIKAGLNDNNISLKALSDNVINLQNIMQASIDANVKAFAGVDRSITAGRDSDSSTKNESKIFYWLIGGMITICSMLVGVIGLMLKNDNRRDKQIFDKLMADKEKYKAIVMESKIKKEA